MPARHVFAALCLPLFGLAACAPQSATGPAAATGFARDNANKAPNCEAPSVAVTAGQAATGSIATGGGGWCGISVAEGGRPFGAGLLTQAPRHGAVYIHTVGETTRVDYTPYAAVAADAFTVKFIPGDQTMSVTVSPAAPAQAAK